MRTKLILSILGIGAVVVPAILLLVFAGKQSEIPEITSGSRSIDTQSVEEVVNKVPEEKIFLSSPPVGTGSGRLSATPSAAPLLKDQEEGDNITQ